MARRVLGLLSVALATVSVVAWAAGPVLHEFLAPDPREDVNLGNVTVSGGFPAAIETPSGIISAPDTLRTARADDTSYSRSTPSQGSTYSPDRDTFRPPPVAYDDPFSPSVTPFKRLNVFDSVRADFVLKVADPVPRAMKPAGGNPGANEEAFYADMTVDLVAGEQVRIPSVAPGSRLLRVHTVPETPVEIFKDGAENWSVLSQSKTRIRLMLFLAAPRDAFGGQIKDSRWEQLPRPVPLPATVRLAAEGVNRTLGISRELSVKEAIEKLVAYYRSFSEGDPPPAKEDIFTDLALSKKGVCRHRAFAFLISALGLGLPARMVTNEAHAWVEIHDGALWRRIDLGGAATALQLGENDKNKQAHSPPADPFSWPPNANTGRSIADSARNPGQNGTSAGNASAASGNPVGSASGRTNGPGGPGSVSNPRDTFNSSADDRPTSVIFLKGDDLATLRNQELTLQGVIELQSSHDRCGSVRVDLSLVSDRGEFTIGSLVSDDNGQFSGTILIGKTIPVGDYELKATTQGNNYCGPGHSL